MVTSSRPSLHNVSYSRLSNNWGSMPEPPLCVIYPSTLMLLQFPSPPIHHFIINQRMSATKKWVGWTDELVATKCGSMLFCDACKNCVHDNRNEIYEGDPQLMWNIIKVDHVEWNPNLPGSLLCSYKNCFHVQKDFIVRLHLQPPNHVHVYETAYWMVSRLMECQLRKYRQMLRWVPILEQPIQKKVPEMQGRSPKETYKELLGISWSVGQ